MRSTHILFTVFTVSFLYILAVSNMGCGQIGFPTGGAKDSIAPRLVSASPKLNSTQVTGNKITLTFDEYVEVREVQTNVMISPFPKKTPAVDFKLKTVTVKLKDSLLPNTTYSINFGNAIVDINEGNPFKDFTYVFSTGDFIDSFTLKGKVVMAETGKADSTILAMLYRSPDDSAVQKNKPDYVAKPSGDGSFTFNNLPAGNFKIYALKDVDGSKTYNAKKEIFAFADTEILISEKNDPVILYAFALEKESGPAAVRSAKPAKKLVLTLPPGDMVQDLLNPFELVFNNPLQDFDPAKLILRDTNFIPIPATWSIDSSRTKIELTSQWQEGRQYRLIIDTTAVTDSAGNRLAKTDTIRFTTKQQSDYGNVVLRFTNLDLSKKPVLQFVKGDAIVKSYPLTSMEWNNKFINPGEYDIRILYDTNNNGKWDPGDYSKKLQPEKAITLSLKLAVRADWDNEKDIKL